MCVNPVNSYAVLQYEVYKDRWIDRCVNYKAKV